MNNRCPLNLIYRGEALRNYINSRKERCIECGITDKAVLVYHHIKPEDKLFALSNYNKKVHTKELVEDEISKCVVLCHNCHMKYHQKHPVNIRKKKIQIEPNKPEVKKQIQKKTLSFDQKLPGPLNALPTYKLERIIKQCQEIIKGREEIKPYDNYNFNII